MRVFREGLYERPTNAEGYNEPIVKLNLKYKYASSVYVFAFHPVSLPVFLRVEESTISTVFKLFKILFTKVNVPFPLSPCIPGSPC